MQATASTGESNGKNHNTDEVKCQRLSPSIQETLKGQSVSLEPRSAIPDFTPHDTAGGFTQFAQKESDQNLSDLRQIIMSCASSSSA